MVQKTQRKVSAVKKRSKRAKTEQEPIPVLTRGCECSCKGGGDGVAGFAYFLGVIGAMVYYVSTASSFWMGVVGVLKALVWPAFLVFELMRMLGV